MQKKGNINFILVGARGTGKTVYLASLYLSEKSVTADDSKTIEYLKPMSDTLLKGKYPSATAGSLHELMFNYKDDEFTLTLQIDDVDGHFIETLSEEDEHTQVEREKLINNLEKSEGIIFFFPYLKHFDIEAIKEFTYQIDTVIAKLKRVYHNRKDLPIPAVIAISKWDDSPDFRSDNEVNKAVEYIKQNSFLKLAKEKIELNFSTLKIVPLSSIGNDINKLEPYNLNKPIQFFLKETFKNWITKIESLKEDREALFIFLSKVHYDVKIYNGGEYDKLYTELEKEHAEKLFKELDAVSNIESYSMFENKNKQLIKALSSLNQEKIRKIKEKLLKSKKSEDRKKKLKLGSRISIITMLFIGIVLMLITWNAKSLLVKNESELFSDIEVAYETNNYTKALTDIADYQNSYEDTVSIEHKNRVIEIKSLIEKEQVLSEVKVILNDSNFNDVDKIDEIVKHFSDMGIEDPELIKQLLKKKDIILTKETFAEFIDKVENKNFEDAIAFIDRNWKSAFDKDDQIIIIKTLNRKYNHKVERILKDISTIVDFDEYTKLVESLNKITSLKNNNIISQLDYKAILNNDNQHILNKKLKVQKKYLKVLEDGISSVNISFGTTSEENEPLGFNCSSESDIVLNIDVTSYSYENENKLLGCELNKISWRSLNQVFKVGRYTVDVTKVNSIRFNKDYDSSFTLSKENLIKLANGRRIRKEIGKSYFIELEGHQ